MAELGMAFLNPIAAQQRMDLEAEAAPSKLAHEQALTRLASAQSDEMETKTAGEKRAAEMMAQRLGAGSAAGRSLSALLRDQATIYAESGLPVKATETMHFASAAQMHEQTAANQEALRKVQQLRAAQSIGQMFANTLGGVKDQESWDAANTAYEKTVGKPSPWANLPYDPTLVATIKEQALTGAQKAKAAIDTLEEARKKKFSEDQIAHRKEQDRIALMRAQVQADREKRLAKAGGKDVGAPTTGEVKVAKEMIGDLVDEKDAATAAFDLASAAKTLRHGNPALSAGEAMHRAFATMKASGDFVPAEPGISVLGFDTGIGKGRPGYRSALDLPASGKKEDLLVGKYYKNSKGVVQRWTASGWEKPSAARSTTPAPDDDDHQAEQ